MGDLDGGLRADEVEVANGEPIESELIHIMLGLIERAGSLIDPAHPVKQGIGVVDQLTGVLGQGVRRQARLALRRRRLREKGGMGDVDAAAPEWPG